MSPPPHQLLGAVCLAVGTVYVLLVALRGGNPRVNAAVGGLAAVATGTYSAGVLGVGGVAVAPWPSTVGWLLDWAVLTPLAVALLAVALRPGSAATPAAGGSISLDGVLRTEVDGAERTERVRWHVPVPSRGELMTMLSVPAALTGFYVVVQPRVRWRAFGYLELSAARASGFTASTPAWAVDYGRLWHAATRFTHVLVHTPEPGHAHLLFNVSLILTTAGVLFVFLHAVGRRRWFAPTYLASFLVAPVLGTYAFDAYGLTAHGYGASTVAFANLGIVTGVSAVYLCRRLLAERRRPAGSTPLVGDGGEAMARVESPPPAAASPAAADEYAASVEGNGTERVHSPLPRTAVWLLVTAVASVVAADAVASAASNSVHLAGYCLGVAGGACLLLVGHRNR